MACKQHRSRMSSAPVNQPELAVSSSHLWKGRSPGWLLPAILKLLKSSRDGEERCLASLDLYVRPMRSIRNCGSLLRTRPLSVVAKMSPSQRCGHITPGAMPNFTPAAAWAPARDAYAAQQQDFFLTGMSTAFGHP